MQNLLMTKSIEDIRDLFILSKIDFNQEMHNCGKTHWVKLIILHLCQAGLEGAALCSWPVSLSVRPSVRSFVC